MLIQKIEPVRADSQFCHVQPWLGNIMLASFANDKVEDKLTILAVSTNLSWI